MLVLLAADWKMAMGSAILVPIVLLPVRTLGRRIRRSVESSQSRLGDLTQILQETFAGNRVVKAFGMERFEIGRFQMAARRLLRENYALDPRNDDHSAADGYHERVRGCAGFAVCAQ